MSPNVQPSPRSPSRVRESPPVTKHARNGGHRQTNIEPAPTLETIAEAVETVLFVSPHADDVVLSCGGLVHGLVHHGVRVHVVTLFAAGPPRDMTEFSELALELHARWAAASGDVDSSAASKEGSGSESHVGRRLAEARRAEDRRAIAILGARAATLDHPDCIYRRQADDWVCPDEAALFGGPKPAEAELVALLAAQLAARVPEPTGTWLIGPAAVGNHVDHHRAREACQAAKDRFDRVLFYEDLPYALGGDPIPPRSAQDEPSLHAIDMPLSPSDLGSKLAAAACYRSQITTFWEDEAAMVAELWRHARRRGGDRSPALAERLFAGPV